MKNLLNVKNSLLAAVLLVGTNAIKADFWQDLQNKGMAYLEQLKDQVLTGAEGSSIPQLQSKSQELMAKVSSLSGDQKMAALAQLRQLKEQASTAFEAAKNELVAKLNSLSPEQKAALEQRVTQLKQLVDSFRSQLGS